MVTPERALATIPGRLAGRNLALWLLAIAVGAAGFWVSLQDAPQRAWQTVWVNFLFWTAIAQAGIIFGAILQAAKGHWGKPFLRVAEGAGAFLPVSFVLFFLLYFGAGHIFPWLQPVEGHINRTWLTLEGVFLRNGILLLVLYGASFVYLRLSLRPDAPLVAERLTGWRRTLVAGLARRWRGDAAEVERSRRILGWYSPALILAWAVVFSFLSYDLAMSLMPGFISVVWGPYYFIGGWLCLLALVAFLSHRYKLEYGLADIWGKWQYHDLGKLIFAFVIFWTYLWWSQFLVVWYGNLGHETIFFEQRTSNGFGPWYTAQMVLIFGVPFLLLLGRRPKMNSAFLAFVATIILAGFWLERFNLVVPSVWQGEGVPLGWMELAISLGFVGLFGLAYSLFASTFPKLQIRDTLVGRASRGP
ncbi:MAG: hypothetical protein ACE5JR_05420 [Gemmatimonadota bacterium]